MIKVLNFGIKKKIISNNIIRPSNMANKLLQRGMKYITDFKDLKEEDLNIKIDIDDFSEKRSVGI